MVTKMKLSKKARGCVMVAGISRAAGQPVLGFGVCGSFSRLDLITPLMWPLGDVLQIYTRSATACGDCEGVVKRLRAAVCHALCRRLRSGRSDRFLRHK